jgi:hypothetical protein
LVHAGPDRHGPALACRTPARLDAARRDQRARRGAHPHRTLGPPIVRYLRQLEGEDTSRRLVVLIAELEPMRAWQWILHNQRGAVLERAVRHDTTNVVVCRIRFQPTAWSAN